MALKPGKLLVALAIQLALSGSQAAAGDAAVALSSLQYLPLSHFVDVTSLEGLADMVVTDTKVAQSPDSVTQNIVVLRGEEIERQPVNNRNLAELMRYTSGQFVNVLSRNDANWGSYAGLGPKYNTWLLDGLPIDSFVDPMSLDAAAVERIEVHKGPASVLYANYLTMDFAGNETPLAGTTNLVLRNRVESPLTRLSAGVASNATYQGRAYTQGRKGNLSYVLGAGLEASDYTQYGVVNSWLQTTNAPDYEKTRFFGNLSYELGHPSHTVSLFLHHTGQDGDAGRPNRDFRHRYDTLNFTYNNRFAADWHVQFKAGERRYDRLFGNDDYSNTGNLALTTHDNTRQTIRPMDLTLSYLHGANSLLTMGMDHQTVAYQTTSESATGVTSRENDASARSTGFFLQEKLQWRHWVFRAGVRHNSINHDYALLGGNVPATDHAAWSKNLWSFGVRNNGWQDLAVYGNVGSSFMVPTAKQIGGTVSAPAASGHLPNAGLAPETGIGRDLGVEWRVSPEMNVGVRAFLNTINNAIVDNVVNPTQSISQNAGRARATGIELDLRHSLGEDLSWFANLTRNWTRVENPALADQNGTAIPLAPDLMVNAGLSAQLPGRWQLSPYFHWVGRYYDSASRSSRRSYGDYGVLNLRLRHAWSPRTELVLDLNNLGNRRYHMPWDFRDPGFHGFAGLNYTF